VADEAFQLTSATTGEEMERTETKRNGRRRGGEWRCRPVVSWMAVSGDVTSVEIVDEIGFSAAAATTAAVSSARRVRRVSPLTTGNRAVRREAGEELVFSTALN